MSSVSESHKPGKIYGQMIKVMAAVGAIGKDRRNTGQGYDFRGIDDVYNSLNHHLAEHGVFSVPKVLSERSEERATKSGGVSIYRVLKIRYRFYADDGSFVDAVVIGEGMDSGDKASNKAMSVAQKYAFIQVFAIPTKEHKDPEHEDHDLAPRDEPFSVRVQEMLNAFRQISVGTPEILRHVGKASLPMLVAADLDKLREWYGHLKKDADIDAADIELGDAIEAAESAMVDWQGLVKASRTELAKRGATSMRAAAEIIKTKTKMVTKK